MYHHGGAISTAVHRKDLKQLPTKKQISFWFFFPPLVSAIGVLIGHFFQPASARLHKSVSNSNNSTRPTLYTIETFFFFIPLPISSQKHTSQWLGQMNLPPSGILRKACTVIDAKHTEPQHSRQCCLRFKEPWTKYRLDTWKGTRWRQCIKLQKSRRSVLKRVLPKNTQRGKLQKLKV